MRRAGGPEALPKAGAEEHWLAVPAPFLLFNGGDAVFPNAAVSIAQRQSLKALGTVSPHGGLVRNRVSAECKCRKPMPRKQESPLLIGGF